MLVAIDIVPMPAPVACVIVPVAYVVNATGEGVRLARVVVGTPQLVAKFPTGVTGQVTPPKPAAGEVDVPIHVARVMSEHDEEPAVLLVPVEHAVQELEPRTEKVLTPHGMGVARAAGQ